MERYVSDEQDRDMLVRYIAHQQPPFTVSFSKGDRRSLAQNRLQHLWIREIVEQYDHNQTVDEVRATLKLRYGVPILREASEAFRKAYDRIFKPLPYEEKIEAMMVMDFSVTRLMTKDQKTQYLNDIHQAFTSKGIFLTDPEERLYEAMKATREKVAA